MKSANVDPKNMSDPHFAAIFGNISCGKNAVIITINPKFDIPYIHMKLNSKKGLFLKDFGKRPPKYMVTTMLIDMSVTYPM